MTHQHITGQGILDAFKKTTGPNDAPFVVSVDDLSLVALDGYYDLDKIAAVLNGGDVQTDTPTIGYWRGRRVDETMTKAELIEIIEHLGRVQNERDRMDKVEVSMRQRLAELRGLS